MNVSEVEKRINAMGLEIPPCPVPVAAYLPAQRAGNLVFVSGNTAWVGDVVRYVGKVGLDVSEEEAYESAKLSVLRCISGLRSVVDLDRARVVYLSGYVNAAPHFKNHPKVVNGASDLIERAFLDKGRHARKAVGMSSLPDDASVEIEFTAVVED